MHCFKFLFVFALLVCLMDWCDGVAPGGGYGGRMRFVAI